MLTGKEQFHWKYISNETDRICWFLQWVHLSMDGYLPTVYDKAWLSINSMSVLFSRWNNKKPCLFMSTWNEGDLAKDIFIYHLIAGLGLLQVCWKPWRQITQVVQCFLFLSSFPVPKDLVSSQFFVLGWWLPNPPEQTQDGNSFALFLCQVGEWPWKVRWKS